jgi:hypothetical protein
MARVDDMSEVVPLKAAGRTLTVPLICLAVGIGLGTLLAGYPRFIPLLGLGPRAAADRGLPEAFQGRVALFILAGQSNMTGFGELAAADPPAHPRAFAFGNDYRWRPAREPIDDPREQVDEVSLDQVVGVGPGSAFAHALLERDAELVVGLIPCAKAGSSIGEWQRNLDDAKLYGSCLKRARAASVTGEIRGFLFFQGEADALDPGRNPLQTPLPDDWNYKFSALISDVRRDLNRPELPVVFAQIGSTTNPSLYPNWRVVQGQQWGVRLAAVAMVATSDLPLQDDVHFTAASYRVIGQRFADAWLRLVREPQGG